MADNKINVGGRLHSIATGNILAGADEILDDSKDKKQSEVNIDVDNALADRYTKDETYNKTELNNLITTPDVQYVTAVATEQTTGVTDVLPSTGAANTIYRVGKWNGTQYNTVVYSEYAWNGSAYVLLDVKEYGIDDEPTAGSDNLVKSGGVSEKLTELAEEVNRNIIGAIDDGTLYDNTNYATGTRVGVFYPIDGFSAGQKIDITLKNIVYAGTNVRIWLCTEKSRWQDVLVRAITSFSSGGEHSLTVELTETDLLTARYIQILSDTNDAAVSFNSFVSLQGDNLKTLSKNIEENENSIISLNERVDNLLDSTSKIGINGTFDVDNAGTDFVVDVRGLETGTYCISLKIDKVIPSFIKCYRTERYKSGIIDSSKYTINTDGTVLEIEKTAETNYLWFFLSDHYTYSAKFYIVKKEYLYEKIIGSIDDINQSISNINDDIDAIQDDVLEVSNNIDGINSRINSFHPYITVDTELPIYRTDEHCYIKTNGGIDPFDNYNVIVYSVSDIRKVKISGRGGTNTVRVYAFYSSDVLGTSTLVGEVGPTHTTDYDYEVNVPAGAVYMACTKYIYQTVLSVTHEELQLDKKTIKEIKVENGNKVTISVPSNNKKLYMVIGPTESGVGNGLIDFRYWGYAPLQSGVDATPVYLYSSTSDCFAPFQIRAINNIDGDDTDNTYFTGGSHKYNNTITGGTPTARLSNVEILVDGIKQTSFSGSFTTFEMTWENYIQATNTRKADGTGREVLKEIISLKYVDGEFKCCTELVPLEDINLVLFYGYQICGINPGGEHSISDHWKYVNCINREIDELKSGNKDTMAMIGDSSTFHQEMWVDTTIDMGKRDMCLNDITTGAFKSGSKGYFTIANNNTTLYKDSHYYLYGKYIFMLKEIS